jgi:hypothetical protein
LVLEVNRVHDTIYTCRYRDFGRLTRRANTLTAAYLLSGLLLPCIHPVGLVCTLAIYGYAAYRHRTG